MPRGQQGAERFRLQLAKEFDEVVGGGLVELKRKVAERVFDVASSRTPVRTGRLKRRWGISIGREFDYSKYGKGELDKIRPFSRVWVHNEDFRASFFEKGTKKMTARPMLRVGIEAAKGIKV